MLKVFLYVINGMAKNYVGTSCMEQDNVLCVSVCGVCFNAPNVGVFEGSAAPPHYCTTSHQATQGHGKVKWPNTAAHD